LVVVLDEQLAGVQLVRALDARGLDVKTLGDFGVTGRPDPDVVRQIGARQPGPWVLVTMDLTILEDHPGFDWGRYALAWIVLPDIRGKEFEEAKHSVIQRRLHEIVEQGPGDHHTYTFAQRHRSPPSLASQLNRRL
jgi:hypothetical protein